MRTYANWNLYIRHGYVNNLTTVEGLDSKISSKLTLYFLFYVWFICLLGLWLACCTCAHRLFLFITYFTVVYWSSYFVILSSFYFLVLGELFFTFLLRCPFLLLSCLQLLCTYCNVHKCVFFYFEWEFYVLSLQFLYTLFYAFVCGAILSRIACICENNESISGDVLLLWGSGILKTTEVGKIKFKP